MDGMTRNRNGCTGRMARTARTAGPLLGLAAALLLGPAAARAADDFQDTLPAQQDGSLRVELDRGSVEHPFAQAGRVIPSVFIRERSVLGAMPRQLAALPSPLIFQPDSSSARRILARSTP